MTGEPSIEKLKERLRLRFPDKYNQARPTDVRNMFGDIIETLETLQCDRRFCPFLLSNKNLIQKENDND